MCRADVGGRWNRPGDHWMRSPHQAGVEVRTRPWEMAPGGQVNELRIEHVAVWARDLERLREFYVSALGGESGSLYVNQRTGFRSYFVSFHGGARLELMSLPGDSSQEDGGGGNALGYAHVAFQLSSREAVDSMVAGLESQGVEVLGRPRLTGDGYYEAVVADPEGNRIELVGPPSSGTESRGREEERKWQR